MARQSVLITGGTGYIGSHLIPFLLDKGFIVHVIVRFNSDLRNLYYLGDEKTHQYDGSFASLEKIFIENDIRIVCHLATNYQKRDDLDYILELEKVTINLTAHLLAAARTNKDFIGFVNVGTIWQLNNNYENSYTLFKNYQDNLVRLFSLKHGVKAISLLLTDTYGPNDWRPKILNIIYKSIIENRSIQLSNPEAILELIYIDDICEALLNSIRLLTLQTQPYEIYKLDAIESVTLQDLVSRIEDLLRIKLDVSFGDRVVSNSNRDTIKTLPGWKPKVDLDTGLRYLLGLVELQL
jgi:nucleoside-diphosphate-sugar epimerase